GTALLDVAQNRGDAFAAFLGEARLDRADRLVARRIAFSRRDLAAFLEDLTHDGRSVVGGGDVADRATHCRAHRGNRAQHDPLVPEILVDVDVEPALYPGLLPSGIDFLERWPCGFAVAFAERDA